MSVDISSYGVTYNTSKTPETRVNTVDFGDGYRQYSIDGINSDNETWSVDFKTMSQIVANNLELILKNSLKGTANYLLWTPPGESVAKYYTATQIRKFSQGPNDWKIQCQFRREFPLV